MLSKEIEIVALIVIVVFAVALVFSYTIYRKWFNSTNSSTKSKANSSKRKAITVAGKKAETKGRVGIDSEQDVQEKGGKDDLQKKQDEIEEQKAELKTHQEFSRTKKDDIVFNQQNTNQQGQKNRYKQTGQESLRKELPKISYKGAVPKTKEPRKTNTLYLDDDKVEIRVIQSIPDPGKAEAKRIGYLPNAFFNQQEPYSYPVVKMPSKNSYIKFPRKGRSDKKGYKENEFKIYLDQYFQTQFNIFNDKHIPTKNGRPYEPDFVMSNEEEGKNIFINIEIDEPYDGWLKTPTHCEGENDLRDDFFTKRGWIVIRFAEIQVHQDPIGCCALVAKVIHSIDETYTSELLGKDFSQIVPQWNNLQAKKWAIERYREKYLGIESFGKRPNIITEYEIFDSNADKACEAEALGSEKMRNKQDGYDFLSKKNKEFRDKRITFDPIEHRYFIDRNPDTISVTQLVNKFFPEFDAPYWAPIKADQRGITTQGILAEWEAKREDSAKKGTALHEAIEGHYNDSKHISTTKEFEFFLDFKKRFNTMRPYRTEWRIFDEDMLVAGTVDMVYKKEDGALFIFDWKRSEKVVYADGTIKRPSFQFASGELGHLADNSYNKYCLQQNIYKAILEKRYSQKISSMNLLVLHEAFDRYHIVQIPEMRKEVNFIFNHLLHLK